MLAKCLFCKIAHNVMIDRERVGLPKALFEFFEDHTLKIYTTKQVYNGVWQLSDKSNTHAVIKLESPTYFIQFPAEYKKLHNKEILCITVENPDLLNMIPDEHRKDGNFVDLILKKN